MNVVKCIYKVYMQRRGNNMGMSGINKRKLKINTVKIKDGIGENVRWNGR